MGLKFSFLILTLITFSFCKPTSLSDGVIVTNMDERNWTNQPEKYPLAAINYEDGYENLLISVSASGEVLGIKRSGSFPSHLLPTESRLRVAKPLFSDSRLYRE